MQEQELKEKVGKNIKFYRFRRQLSQADLAEKAQISITSLSDIERGNNFPQAKTLCNLALALNVEVWSLFRGEDISDDQNSVLEHFSEDFSRHINIAIETVRKQYIT
ncbi:MAG: helix-turn-helix domain-containing protein [Treponema sp.]|nr:helix-turn-helix domain-containing protein [Treponema sp.]MCL2237224.1 helix-turn-helix domain-containing protein [Treponema sp.]